MCWPDFSNVLGRSVSWSLAVRAALGGSGSLGARAVVLFAHTQDELYLTHILTTMEGASRMPDFLAMVDCIPKLTN